MGVNNICSYGRVYDYAGAGVNSICFYVRTTTHELASAGANNLCTYDHDHEMSSYLCATPNWLSYVG